MNLKEMKELLERSEWISPRDLLNSLSGSKDIEVQIDVYSCDISDDMLMLTLWNKEHTEWIVLRGLYRVKNMNLLYSNEFELNELIREGKMGTGVQIQFKYARFDRGFFNESKIHDQDYLKNLFNKRAKDLNLQGVS